MCNVEQVGKRDRKQKQTDTNREEQRKSGEKQKKYGRPEKINRGRKSQ